ncbi:hypothetical protein [Sphingopyxis sp.]|jgi:hypothetical protein|uniref:hypothetical protein n=1 Tax=Sphingopyxis sp. TaxID=1908224 RepID=UPI003F72E423
MNSRAKPVNPPGRKAAAAAPAASAAANSAPADPAAPVRARTNSHFRKNRTPLPRDDAKRQGDISQFAFLTMGGRDPAVEFLNSDNAQLGGRPLALATASAEGYEQVAAAIRAMAPGGAAS